MSRESDFATVEATTLEARYDVKGTLTLGLTILNTLILISLVM